MELLNKATSDWPMAVHLMKEELKCATMDSGELFVMMLGVEMMPRSLVDSWDSHHGVRETLTNHSRWHCSTNMVTTS